MGLLDRFRKKRAATLSNPPTWLVEALTGGGSTAAGRTVSVDASLGVVPVYSAVSQIAGAIGSLPLMVYRRVDEGKERAENHRTWPLLHNQPNDEMAADEVWEIVGSHLLLWGNAFLVKQKNAFGLVEGLWPLDPARVSVGRDDDGTRFFSVDNRGPFYEDRILHIRGLSKDGLVGYSPIQKAKETIANSIAQQEFQGKFLANDGRPSVILRHPQELTSDAAKRLKASWENTKSGGTAVLEEGIEVERWTMPLNDAQFLEAVQFSDLRIAQLFNLPPAMLGAKSGDSLTYSTTELQGIQFVTNTLRRWLVRIESALLRDPDIFVQGDRFFCEFLTDALLRADTKSRYQAYALADFMTTNEKRRRENLPAIEGGDEIAAPSPAAPPESSEEGT